MGFRVCFHLRLGWAPALMTVRPTLPFGARPPAERRPALRRRIRCLSLPPLHRDASVTALCRQRPPPPRALGLSDEPASGGSGFCGMVPTAHFPLGSPGNHQKATAPDANAPLPSDKLSIPLLSLGWLQGWVCQRLAVCQGGREGPRLCSQQWLAAGGGARLK